MHEFQELHPVANMMHILLTNDDTAVFDHFIRKLNEIRIVRTHYAIHLGSSA